MLLMSILRGARGGAVGWGRKVAGSIPDGVIGIFHRHNSSGRNMALGLTQPLTETSTRNIPVRRADNLTTFMCRLSWNLGASNFGNPQGLSRPVIGLLYLCFYVHFERGVERNSLTSHWLTLCNEIHFTLGFFCNSFSRNRPPWQTGG